MIFSTDIYKALQAYFETSALTIQRAETIRTLKVVKETGNVETFQTAWAALKFGAAPSPEP